MDGQQTADGGHELRAPAAEVGRVPLWPYLTGAAATVSVAVVLGLALSTLGPLATMQRTAEVAAPGFEDPIVLTGQQVHQAAEAAGCEVLVERDPLEDRTHVDPAEAPPLSELYPDVRPTHSGRHAPSVHPLIAAAGTPIDELSSTHNLEHGTVILWWDPAQVDDATAAEIGELATGLNASGFSRADVGVGVMSAPFDDPGIGSGGAVAFRAWGTAVDCERWDRTAALAFVAEHFGERGISPERTLAPYPDGVLELSTAPIT